MEQQAEQAESRSWGEVLWSSIVVLYLMAAPAWFFSALAQSSAAIVGFVIALSAVRYQLERRRREERTDDLREELISYRNKYQQVIIAMLNTFGHQYVDVSRLQALDVVGAAESRDAFRFPLRTGVDEAWESVEEDDRVERPTATLVYLHLLQVRDVLGEVEASGNPTDHYLLSGTQLDTLAESVSWLADNFFRPQEDHGALVAELQGETQSDTDPYTADVFAETAASKVIGAWIRRHEQGFGGESVDVDFTASDVATWSLVFDELWGDFQTVDAKRGHTMLDFTPRVHRILLIAGILVVVGVFAPVLFLIRIPSGELLLAIQASLLVLSGTVIAYLLWLVHEALGLHTANREASEE